MTEIEHVASTLSLKSESGGPDLPIMATFASSSFKDMLLNWIVSVKRAKMGRAVLVAAFDEVTFQVGYPLQAPSAPLS